MGRGGYNGGEGEVGALWPPRSFSFGCSAPVLNIVVSEVEILLPFLLLSFVCFLRSAVLFE